MANRTVDVLGSAARLARAAHLESVASVARDTVDAVFRRVGRPPLAATIGGVTVRGYLRHRSFLAEAAKPGTTYRELFVQSLRPGTTVVDGGAHVGLYTVLAARAGADILAFEPDAYNFRALEFNARSYPNAHLAREALAERRRTACLHRSSGTISSSLLARDTTVEAVEIAVTSIDEALAGRDLKALVVKLNVEGAEPLALEGMRETAARCDDVTVFVEVAPHLLGEQTGEVVPQLEGLGLDVFAIRLADQSLTRVRPAEPLAKGHLYCVRPRSTRGPSTPGRP